MLRYDRFGGDGAFGADRPLSADPAFRQSHGEERAEEGRQVLSKLQFLLLLHYR